MSTAEDSTPGSSKTSVANAAPGQGNGFERIEKLNWPWLTEPWRAVDPAKAIENPVVALVPENFSRNEARLHELKAVVERNVLVEHPNVVPTRKWLVESGRPELVLSCGRASSLSQLLAARPGGFYELAHVKYWLAQVCSALGDCHAAGLLHGWLTARDILITSTGDLQVANFGVTRLLAADGGADEGMLAALSPQALGGAALTESDDIYSLGALIYELLTGAPVFTGEKLTQKIMEEKPVALAARREQLQRPGAGVPAYLEEVVAACLAKDAAARPTSVREVSRWLGIEVPALRVPLLPVLAGTVISTPADKEPASVAAVVVKPDVLTPAGKEEEPAASKPAPTLSIPVPLRKEPEVPTNKELAPAREEATHPAGAARKRKILWILAATGGLAAAAYLASTSTQPTQNTGQPAGVTKATPTATAVATPSPTPLVLATPVAAPKTSPSAAPTVVTQASPTVSPLPSGSPAGPIAVLPDNLPSLAPASPGASASAAPTAPILLRTNSLGMKFAPVGNVMFCIWETRRSDFEKFATEENIRNNDWKEPGFAQGPDHPVVYVSWDDAVAFCKWLTDKEHQQGVLARNEIYRLPTDLEWSKAVGLPAESGSTPESRDMGVPDVYPWGTQWPPPPGAGNYTGDETGSDVAIHGYDDGFVWTAPVGSFKPNAYGLYDMGGNVWEWCLDYWNNGHRARVLRGGSWYNGNLKLSLLSSCRVNASQDSSTDNYGFRIVIAPSSSASPSGKP
ncbi:MAG: SUMF1/EgtB/PvdO family nonheme iron enzyme [Chthoniobacteraceae bacterium]